MLEAVAYAGLPSSPWYAAANRYAPQGVGAVLSFELKGGVGALKREKITAAVADAAVGD